MIVSFASSRLACFSASISANSTDKKKGQRKEEGNIGVGKGDRGAKRLDVIKAKSYT